MNGKIEFKNNLKQLRAEKKMSQGALAEAVGVSRNTISSIEIGQYCPTAKLAYSIAIVLDKKFEDVFYFEGFDAPKPLVSEPALSDQETASLSDKAFQRIKKYLEDKSWSASEILDLIIYITK